MLPVVGFIQAGSLESQFFPSVQRDQFQIEVEFANQSAIAQSQSAVMGARDLLLAHEQIKQVQWFVGESAPKFYYNIPSTTEKFRLTTPKHGRSHLRREH
ncbi:MAG: efflux RND transporter permease subunit [Leptolyngbyaceae cyanobacterium SM1_1_3]|nr:efflux RND transporter permease subunit [Leptolyngbyaceae cyanobacterium SM1_1_3]